MTVNKPTNIIEKLQERLNHRFTALEEDILHFIREELSSLEITSEPFCTVRDVWNDIEPYSFDENLSNRCEEKIQAFLYELLADCVKELGMDEVRTYLINQGWTDEVEAMDIEDWGLLALLGLTGVFLYNVCFFIATKYAPIVKSSLVIAVNAPLITLFAALFLKEKITAKNIVGLVMALFGAVYIITNGHPSILLELGVAPIDLVLIGACLSWSIYSVVGKVVMKKYSPLAATTYATGFGTLFLAPFALYYTSFASVKASGWEVWLSILYVAVIVSVVSFVWWYNGIQKVGASTSSIFINVMPISAAVMGTIFFDEQLTHVHIVGALFVFGGTLFNMYSKQQKKEAPSKENITA
ncbi:DMT family transporter [Anoxybacteroides amylolyticum]|uniref:UAA transporter family protein n=1 Tax=Anoxybacteroides amylolyticum TaxID=294699 RepID=A0A160F1L6_9BACL|nr:DMT family transporter [Anoxybacillus amylolyticus]ANB60047.1 UAA transporter family protein [Anoxybacillus amylolyticus]